MNGRDPLGWRHSPAGYQHQCRTPGRIQPMETPRRDWVGLGLTLFAGLVMAAMLLS